MKTPNREELQEIFKRAKQYVRDRAIETGTCIYYVQDGKRIREDPATNERFIQLLIDGKLKEFPLAGEPD